MKRLILPFIVLLQTFTVLSNSQKLNPALPAPLPINNFSFGEYLGGGNYNKTTGESGTYNSFIKISDNEMTAYAVFNNESVSYHFSFDFNNSGFFDLDIFYYDI